MFSWLNPKKGILELALLRGMTDIHSHLLPGVDDGAANKEDTLVALQFLEEEIGVVNQFFTPHIMDDLPENTRTVLLDRFNSFLSSYHGGISVRLSGEYMLDAGFRQHLSDGLLTMADNHVLIETSYLSAPPEMESLLYEILVSGYTPVIAHPERYVYMSDNERYQLKDHGCKFQLNLMSLAGTYGKGAFRCAHTLLSDGFYDFVGSDYHRIEVYKRSLRHLFLQKREQRLIEQLLENNRMLWE